MKTFILFTRLVSEEVHPTFSVVKKEKHAVEKIKELCPSVKWLSNYAVTGPWDYVDIFSAPDQETAMRVSALIRHYGGAHTEVWPAIEWNAFEKNMQMLAEAVEK